MNRAIRVLSVGGTPEQMGTGHGRSFAAEIRDYTEDRVVRSGEGTGWSRMQILTLAEDCLPAHEEYAPDLYEEMVALADAAGISPAEAMIVGGYTDFIDTVRAHAGAADTEDTCTAVIVPDTMAEGAGFLAQTWDMHASATPHIVMLRIAPQGKPSALVFTTVGCLGQIGMNEAGIAVGINNLTAADGRIGVTWPFVVRKALEQTEIEAALRCVLEAELAGGHNFLLFDRGGRGYSVEAMPTATHVDALEGSPLVHTNHCLASNTQLVEGPRPDLLQSSSVERMASASGLLQETPVTVEALMALTREESSICRRPEPPYDYESCGAMIMRPRTAELWACWGVPAENEFERFDLEVRV